VTYIFVGFLQRDTVPDKVKQMLSDIAQE